MSVQNLRLIFPEQMTAKRVSKQIKLISETPQVKNNLDIKFFFIKGELLNVSLSFRSTYFQSLPQSKRPKEEIKISIYYTNNYPYQRPKMFINCNFLNEKHTVACRDYMQELCKGNWATNYQLLDLIKFFLPFYVKIIEADPINLLGTYTRGDYLQQDFYTQRSVEFYPINIKVEQKFQSAYLLIHRLDIIFLERTSLDRYCRLVEVYPIDSIKSIHCGKSDTKQLMLCVKWGSVEGGFEFRSEDAQKIIESIVDKKKFFQKQYKQIQEIRRKAAQTANEKQNNNNKPQPQARMSPDSYLQELNESIMIVESLLEKQFSDAQVSNLISLYKKAVEFCSANNISNYTFYLKKLQELMQKEETKALMNSMSQNKPEKIINQSIFDVFELDSK